MVRPWKLFSSARNLVPMRLAFAPLQGRVGARQLHGRFPRFGAAVAEEGAIEPGPLRQPHGELRLALVEVQIRDVHQLAALLADGLSRPQDDHSPTR